MYFVGDCRVNVRVQANHNSGTIVREGSRSFCQQGFCQKVQWNTHTQSKVRISRRVFYMLKNTIPWSTQSHIKYMLHVWYVVPILLNGPQICSLLLAPCESKLRTADCSFSLPKGSYWPTSLIMWKFYISVGRDDRETSSNSNVKLPIDLSTDGPLT